jgi:hypothetical protein
MTDVIDDADEPIPKRTPEKTMTLVQGAAHETRIIDTAKAEKLRQAIGDAMTAYWEYLDRHGVITDGCEMLIATCTTLGWETELRNGALDVLYRDAHDGESNGDVETWGKCEEWPRTYTHSPMRVLADGGQVHELNGKEEWTIYRIFPLAEFKEMVEQWPPGYGHGLTVTMTMCCDYEKTGGAALLEFMEEQAEKKRFLLIIDDDGATTAERIWAIGQKYAAPGGPAGKLD